MRNGHSRRSCCLEITRCSRGNRMHPCKGRRRTLRLGRNRNGTTLRTHCRHDVIIQTAREILKTSLLATQVADMRIALFLQTQNQLALHVIRQELHLRAHLPSHVIA